MPILTLRPREASRAFPIRSAKRSALKKGAAIPAIRNAARAASSHRQGIFRGVVYVIEDSGVIHVNEAGAAGVAADNQFGLRFGRQLEELRDQFPAEKDGVAASSLESRNGQRRIGRVKKRGDCGRLYIGMIDEREEDARGSVRNQAQAALHRRKLAKPVVDVLGEQSALRMADAGANAPGLAAHHDDYRRAEFRKAADQLIEKSLTAKIEERLG